VQEKKLFFNKRIELGYARKKGLEEGIEKGMEKGMEKGRLNTQIAIAKKAKTDGIVRWSNFSDNIIRYFRDSSS